MPQSASNSNDVAGTIATIFGMVFSFLTDNWVQILTLTFSAIALVYTVRNAKASLVLKGMQKESERLDIEIKQEQLKALKAEPNNTSKTVNQNGKS